MTLAIILLLLILACIDVFAFGLAVLIVLAVWLF